MTVTFSKLLVNTFVSVGWLLLSLVTLGSFQFSLMPPINYCFFLLTKQLCLLFHCKIRSMTVPCPPSIAMPLPSIRGLGCSSLLNAKCFTCVLVQYLPLHLCDGVQTRWVSYSCKLCSSSFLYLLLAIDNTQDTGRGYVARMMVCSQWLQQNSLDSLTDSDKEAKNKWKIT